MAMNVYAGSGTYIISYLAIELDDNGFICFEKKISDTITVVCDSCLCGGFTDMFIRFDYGAPSQQMTCGGDPISLGCPNAGFGYSLTGLFQCEGDTCPIEHLIQWNLTGPGASQNGSFWDNDPYWGINLLPNYFTQSGLYTLTLTGNCGGDECPCVIQFEVNCPNLCPCEPEDIQALSNAVDKGFAQALYNNSCKACFSPIALSDCESVSWHIGNPNNPAIGNSTGTQTFCNNFGSSGSYTVYMVVTRLKPDGSLCETFVKSQTVNLTCSPWADCDISLVANPRFSEGAVAGGLNSGGATDGWNSLYGEPQVLEGQALGSFNDWTMMLTGNYDHSDVLSTMEPICLEKDTGMVSLRLYGDPIPGVPIMTGRRPPGSKLSIQFFQGNNFSLNGCTDASCYTLARMTDLLPLDSNDWVEIQIPFNLSDWETLEPCGSNGVLVRPAIFVTNTLGENQGGMPTRHLAILDNVCINGTTVGVKDIFSKNHIRIFPNPTIGNVMIELSQPATGGMVFRITDLIGKQLLEKVAEIGKQQQTMEVNNLPLGIYFLQVFSEGKIIGAEKLVKQ